MKVNVDINVGEFDCLTVTELEIPDHIMHPGGAIESLVKATAHVGSGKRAGEIFDIYARWIVEIVVYDWKSKKTTVRLRLDVQRCSYSEEELDNLYAACKEQLGCVEGASCG